MSRLDELSVSHAPVHMTESQRHRMNSSHKPRGPAMPFIDARTHQENCVLKDAATTRALKPKRSLLQL